MIYRVYYNRAVDWPQVWSVDEGSQETEINVVGIRLLSAVAESKEIAPADREGKDPAKVPFGWLEVTCSEMRLVGGWANFY